MRATTIFAGTVATVLAASPAFGQAEVTEDGAETLREQIISFVDGIRSDSGVDIQFAEEISVEPAGDAYEAGGRSFLPPETSAATAAAASSTGAHVASARARKDGRFPSTTRTVRPMIRPMPNSPVTVRGAGVGSSILASFGRSTDVC